MRPSSAPLALICLALAACGPKAGPPGSAVPVTGATLARLDDSVVTQGHLDALRSMLPAEQAAMLDGPQQAEILKELVMEQLLYDEAVANGLHRDPTVQLEIAIASRQRLAELQLRRSAEAAATDVAVAKRYRESLGEQTRPEVKARHILVETEAEAQAVKAELDGGADFVALAKERSVGPSGPDGGDLGWFTSGQMVGPFAEAAFAADKGTITAPVQTRFGWHVILVEDKRDQVPLEEAAPQIREALVNEALAERLQALRERATVVAPGGDQSPEQPGK